jgi:hypothetical protein
VRGRRLGPVLVAAAVVVAMAVAAVALRARDDANDTDGPVGPARPAPWVVTDRVEIRGLGSGARVLAAAAGWTAVGARGSTTLAVVDERDPAATPETVTVPATAALAADGDRVWLLDTDGSLHRVDRDGAVTTVARLGRAADHTPIVAVSGGAVFVAGTDAGALVRVDPDSGEVRPVSVDAPTAVAGSEEWLWSVDGGRRVARVDPRSLQVVHEARPEPVTAIAAGGEQAFALHGDSGTVDVLGADGTQRGFARVAPSVSGIVVAGDRLWATDSGVLTAYELEGGTASRPLALGRVPDQAMAAGSDALWTVGPGVELLRIGPG